MKTDPTNTQQPVRINDQQFKALTMLEEALIKNRGLNCLLSNILPFDDSCLEIGQADVSAIQVLSIFVTMEVENRFNELHQILVKPGVELPAQAPASGPVSESLPESRISGDAPDLAPMRPKSAARVLQRGSGVLQRGSAESPDSHPAASAV
jgi:hypothetical protein